MSSPVAGKIFFFLQCGNTAYTLVFPEKEAYTVTCKSVEEKNEGTLDKIMKKIHKKRQKLPRSPLTVVLNVFSVLMVTAVVLGMFFPGAKPEHFPHHADGEMYPEWLPGSGVTVPDYVQQVYLPVNPWSRPGEYLREVNGVVIHYVGNPGSSAMGNRNYFASLSDGAARTYASSHFIVGLDGEVIQCIPLQEIAYASNERNRDTIAIEVCHPGAGGQFNDTTYAQCVNLTAWLCKVFALNPETDVIRHYDVTGKICPRYYVEHPEAWDTLRYDIAAALESYSDSGEPPETDMDSGETVSEPDT